MDDQAKSEDELVAEFIDFARYLEQEPTNQLRQKREVSVRMIRAVANALIVTPTLTTPST